MGQYGHRFDSLIESKNREVENISISESTFGFVSVAYDEYMNRCSLLESCTEDSKAILEAQIEVLKEVSIKDIFSKLIDKVKEVFQKIKKFFKKISDKISNEYMNPLINVDKALEEFDEKKKEYKGNKVFYNVPARVLNLASSGNLLNQLPLQLKEFKVEEIKKDSGNSDVHFHSDREVDLSKFDREVEDFFKHIGYEELKGFDFTDYDQEPKNFTVSSFNKVKDTLETLRKTEAVISAKEDQFSKDIRTIQKAFSGEEHFGNRDVQIVVNAANRDLTNIGKLSNLYAHVCFELATAYNRNIETLAAVVGNQSKSRASGYNGKNADDMTEKDKEEVNVKDIRTL